MYICIDIIRIDIYIFPCTIYLNDGVLVWKNCSPIYPPPFPTSMVVVRLVSTSFLGMIYAGILVQKYHHRHQYRLPTGPFFSSGGPYDVPFNSTSICGRKCNVSLKESTGNVRLDSRYSYCCCYHRVMMIMTMNYY